jgi:hypothetical protein
MKINRKFFKLESNGVSIWMVWGENFFIKFRVLSRWN